MNIQKVLSAIFSIAVIIGLSAVAKADCIGPCTSGGLSFTLGGGAGFNGIGNGVYSGQTGSVDIVESGASGIDIDINASGQGCTVNCGNFNWQFQGFARDQVQVHTSSFGNTSGTPVQSFSEGSSAGIVNFQFKPLSQQ
jgi:hypothetical protein